MHLSRDERNAVVSATREVLDADSALKNIPLIVGTSASSTRETIEFTKDAARLGADFAMVIGPGAHGHPCCLRPRFMLTDCLGQATLRVRSTSRRSSSFLSTLRKRALSPCVFCGLHALCACR